MKNSLQALMISFFYVTLSFGQLGMGAWRMHISPFNAVEVVKSKSSVHCALENGLLSYYIQNGEKTLRTATDYLSDVEITALGHDPLSDAVFIGYQNGNVDMLFGEQIINLNAILVSSVSGIKQINKIVAHDGNVYLATGFGIVVINVNRREVRDTYYPTGGNQGVVDLAFSNDSIYALTNNGLMVGALANNFLADQSQWIAANYLPNYQETGIYNAIETFQDKLFIAYNDEVYNGDTLFQWDHTNLSVFMDETELNGLSSDVERLFVNTDGAVFDFGTDFTQQELIYQYSHGLFPRPVNTVYVNGHYYIADLRSGLVRAVNAFASNLINFEGPRFSDAYKLNWNNGKLAVSAGGLASSNNPSFSNKGAYTFSAEKWVSFSTSDQSMISNTTLWDFVSCAVNPRNTNEVAFGTYSFVPLIRSTDGITISDTFGFGNSAIAPTSLGNGWGHISDLVYDGRSNLWMLNSFTAQPLKVLTSDDEWITFNIGGGVGNRRTTRLVIDNNNVKWFAVQGLGVIAFDENGTLDDPSDDRYRVLTTDPNSGDLPNANVETLAVDFDNNIWVGTPEGMRVLYNSRNVFDADPGQFNFQRLLIEFGENVEIVLGSTHITSIEIDGGNRKWIGTANSGVFLFSPDGLTVIKNFTAQNSPLLSNTIYDMVIDEFTGEVFFATSEGLVSYRSDASTGDNSYSNVTVFPNPVYPDYFGPITIQGIATNSDVRITDVSGKLVYQTVSNGGTATWHGRTLDGKRATTGVYLIWTTIDSENEKGRKVGKVVFIN